jgi:uncharacterized protein (DUF342 family)
MLQGQEGISMDSTTSPPKLPESQAVQPPGQAHREADQISFELTVSENKLEAYISAQVKGGGSITIENLKTFLKEKHISYGLVNDSEIENYISQGVILRDSCLMARGLPPQPGKDAQITFFFDRDPHKTGKIKDGGVIDFREKGDIPQVKPGDVLAEKIPLIKEKAGIDVYGQPISMERAKDAVMSSGTGTQRSPDGLKICAQTAGRPEVLSDRRVCVFSEIRINGDVNLETGHIRFDGFVDVGGTIQEGFRVKAGKLASKEIFRAEVDVDGDITVDGGIIGATVSSRGNVKCRFIDASHIVTLGDVIVESEVVDSKIETNGALIVTPAGRILASQVMAKKGVVAAQIGSETSKPCTLTVGVDTHARRAVITLKEEIAKKEEEKKQAEKNLERISSAFLQLSETISKWTHIKDQTILEQSSIKEKLEELKQEKNPTRLSQTRWKSREIEQKLVSTEDTLKKLQGQQDQLTQTSSALQSIVQELDSAIQGLQREIRAKLEEAQLKEKPTVKVTKAIYDGTTVEGLHSTLVLKENLPDTVIREEKVRVVSPEGEETFEWQMKWTPHP